MEDLMSMSGGRVGWAGRGGVHGSGRAFVLSFRFSRLRRSVDALALLRVLVRSAGSALRAPAGSVAVRAVVQPRPPLVLALDVAALPLRLVVRPFRHRRRRLVLVDVLARQLLPELAVLLAPREEVVRLARR
eukprot:30259-Pelagococcus_subviridis.AAC.3